MRLPAGMQVRELSRHVDARGSFMELFRYEWELGCEARQWNVVDSRAGVLRGVHVHVTHWDYLTVVSGTLLLGLHDLRTDSETVGLSCFLRLEGDSPRAVSIPPGVCHGFYYPRAAVHIYAVSEYWNPADELGCRFDCPELGLDWPEAAPILSDRDRDASGYAAMRRDYSELASARAAGAP